MTSGSPPHDPTRILTEPEVAEATRELRKLMARDFPTVPADLFGNSDHMVRLLSLNARFKQAREASGRTIKQIAAELKVPQYRLKAIEKGRLLDVDGAIMARYGAGLSLEAWLAMWVAANGRLAAELGMGPPVDEVAPVVSAEAAPADAPKLTLVRPGRAAGAWKPQLVYRFRVKLQEVAPPVWRLIEVSATDTFWALHVAIQDAMGWTDSHLHAFHLPDGRGGVIEIGIPGTDEEYEVIAGWRRQLKRHFKTVGQELEYEYDFGDDWKHTVLLEGILLADEDGTYPRCLAGARKCPPEDCGGAWGYEEFLAAIADPAHEEHEQTLEWCGGAFDPEEFAAAGIVFDDPLERLRGLQRDW